MTQAGRLILFSGGGTAGHLAPGFALAAALERRQVAVRFATPGEAPERAWFQGREPPDHLPAVRLPRGPLSTVLFPFRLLRCVLRARRFLKRERMRCVVALGGWPCAPAVLAARLRRLPYVFLVADAVPGVVVRKLAARAGRIYVAHARAGELLGGGDRVRHTGPLLRARIGEGRRDPEAFGLRPGRRTLFVTGGSLGARGLNERFVAGLADALRADEGLRGRIQVLHSAGPDAEWVAARYADLDVIHHVVPYVQAMGTAYRTADLVLSRAGASTCAELLATASPAVLVPYPHHPDRQQFRNAERLVACGGARLIEEADLTPALVRAGVLELLENGPALDAMRAGFAEPSMDGPAETADDLIRFLGWGAQPQPVAVGAMHARPKESEPSR